MFWFPRLVVVQAQEQHALTAMTDTIPMTAPIAVVKEFNGSQSQEAMSDES